MEALPAYAVFPVINCGLDWITATSRKRGVQNDLEDFGVELLKRENAGEGRISPAYRLGYKGHRSGNIFLGDRPGDVMIQISGPCCSPLAHQVISRATNVSRLDFQVTVWTEGEAVNLAKWTFEKLLAQLSRGPARGTISLLQSQPTGDTLSIGKRSSQRFGRLYDKTAEGNLGPPQLVWRYEVELKGEATRPWAKRLAEFEAHPLDVSKLVHDYYTRKGVQPSFAPVTHENAFQPYISAPTRDVLTWFRTSVSKTIKTAIANHGRGATLDALGLSDLT